MNISIRNALLKIKNLDLSYFVLFNSRCQHNRKKKQQLYLQNHAKKHTDIYLRNLDLTIIFF